MKQPMEQKDQTKDDKLQESKQENKLVRGTPWGDRLLRIHKTLHNPLTKATLLFLKATQPLFDVLNLVLGFEC